MLWGRRKEENGEIASKEAEKSRLETDAATPTKPTPLTPELQKLVDEEDDFIDQLYDGSSQDTTETPYRYAAYATRIRTLMLSAHRYVAYTSDIGESFRPVAHPYIIRSAYGISWAYILGDVAHEGYKAYQRNKHVLAPPSEAYRKAAGEIGGGEGGVDRAASVAMGKGEVTLTHAPPVAKAGVAGAEAWEAEEGGDLKDSLIPWTTKRIPLREDYRTVMAERAVFQVLASMALPAFTIHSVVKYAGKALREQKNTIIRTWGPIGLGLSIVPLLPYIFDKPVESAVEYTFQTALQSFAGEAAVTPTTSNAAVSNSLRALRQLKQQQKMKRAEVESGEAGVSWEEYKAEKNAEREERRRERERRGKLVVGKAKEE
ncbi:hypothetical protein FQN54_002299 [Arachnomyces sp. PD_36]|nr:hypothetical protein FQN54_002299 [Arachnomyces sp. PD_36]